MSLFLYSCGIENEIEDSPFCFFFFRIGCRSSVVWVGVSLCTSSDTIVCTRRVRHRKRLTVLLLMANGLSDFRSTYGEERTVLASEKAIGRLGEVFVLAEMGSRLPAG